MKDLPEELDCRGSARRKLVRGSFAVPAVLTLHSGSSFAAGSTGACLVKRNTSPQTALVGTTDDNFLRYQLYAFVKNPGLPGAGNIRGGDGYWIKGSELTVYVRAGQTPFLTSTSWQKIDIVTNVLTGAPQTSLPVCTAGTPTNFTLKKVSQFVSLRVDANGRIAGAGSSGSGSAVGDSCWNSFAAAAPL